eukprot:GFUD01024714.1.p1 GENE.GFUD01024714.1~~GFUD01024714.1.p1  ORF type:complete len:349 (-),score=113.72 GFUD01024714.1:70-1116(-)
MEEHNGTFLKACEEGQLSQVEKSIIFADVNVVEKVDGNSGLMIASRDAHREVVNFLLDNAEVDVNLSNKFGYTALMLAAQNGNMDILEMLLEIDDVDLDIVNKAGRKAEECARKKNKAAIQERIASTRVKRKSRKNKGIGKNNAAKRQRDMEENGVGNLNKVSKKNENEEIVVLKESVSPQKVLKDLEMINDNHDATNEDATDDDATKATEKKVMSAAYTLEEDVRSPQGTLRSVTPTIKDILTARLENCLIDLGTPKENVILSREMLSMSKKLNLEDLQSICRKILIENLSRETVFDLLEVFDEDTDMKNICLNFLVANIDEMRLIPEWKPMMRKHPSIAIELIDRL